MKKLILVALTSVALSPVVATAQTMPMIIENWSGDRVIDTEPQTFDERVETAAKQACAKPFIRDLKGQQLYAECLADARAQAEAILAERLSQATELALR